MLRSSDTDSVFKHMQLISLPKGQTCRVSKTFSFILWSASHEDEKTSNDKMISSRLRTLPWFHTYQHLAGYNLQDCVPWILLHSSAISPDRRPNQGESKQWESALPTKKHDPSACWSHLSDPLGVSSERVEAGTGRQRPDLYREVCRTADQHIQFIVVVHTKDCTHTQRL